MDKKALPIGVFDSGVGGLTVLKQLMASLPNETFIYLGDTARVPYGTRSKETIKTFALQMEKFLLEKNVKALVVACNTISATSLPEIKRNALGVPVIDVISPTIDYVVSEFKKTIGVIGTRATINSNVYEKLIRNRNPKIRIKSQSASMFVPLVEEGLIHSEATRLIAEKYLEGFHRFEALILGCTHYPLLSKIIEEILPEVSIIDSAHPTARVLNDVLISNNLKSDRKYGKNKYFVTDDPRSSQKVVDLLFDKSFSKEFKKIKLNY